jgi:uncharacterized membrane protein
MIIYVDFRKRPDNPILGFIVAVLLAIPFWVVAWPLLCWALA